MVFCFLHPKKVVECLNFIYLLSYKKTILLLKSINKKKQKHANYCQLSKSKIMVSNSFK